ncbi:PQQ-binding-like beta-propeller repeat protein [Micromonospora psammae]|uniref:PQQ-binding-like beta-propeller repeat protein n=1 Tax=Micromonospora sp. CPCC 205556 TaxID=3122398 RepID=UPI002FF42293
MIDLGEIRADAEPEPLRRPPRAAGRPLRVALLAVLLVVSMAGAAAPPQRSLFTVPAGPTTSAVLHGDLLFVLERGDTPAARGGQLVAYAVPADGTGPLTPRWRAPLPAASAAEGVSVVGDMVLVTGGATPEAPARTAAFDLATGVRRWELPGVAFRSGEGLLMVDGGGDRSTEFRSVELATGRVSWSLSTPPDASWRWGPDGIDRIVATPASGEVQIWDPRSGVRLRAANIRPGELPTPQRAQPVGDLLLVVGENATRVTAYGLDELDRRWEAGTGASHFESCGALICGYGHTEGMWALDRATGDVRWRADRWNGRLTERDGRMLVMAPHTGGRETLAILDTATGRTVAELGSWQLASWYPFDGRLIGSRRAGTGRLVVADLDPAAGEARALDVVTGVTGDCQATPTLLLCRRGDDAYGIWRLPR